jgi:hypothetical protein
MTASFFLHWWLSHIPVIDSLFFTNLSSNYELISAHVSMTVEVRELVDLWQSVSNFVCQMTMCHISQIFKSNPHFNELIKEDNTRQSCVDRPWAGSLWILYVRLMNSHAVKWTLTEGICATHMWINFLQLHSDPPYVQYSPWSLTTHWEHFSREANT